MGHTAAVTPLAELLKAFGCADIIAPVDAVAFGRRAGELMTRVAFGKTAGALLTRVVSDRQHPRRYVPKIDRVPIGGPNAVGTREGSPPGMSRAAGQRALFLKTVTGPS